MEKREFKLNEVIDKVYVINLNERKDRLKEFSSMCGKFGIEFERVSAVDGDRIKFPDDKEDMEIRYNRYAEALVRTTHKILVDAKDKGYEKILIFEDDADIRDNFLMRLEYFYDFDHAHEWDMFFFGYRTLSRPKDTKFFRIKEVTGCNACHCYAIHSRIFDELIKLTKKKNAGMPIDGIYEKEIQPKATTYCSSVPLVGQREGYSNIELNVLKNRDL